MAKTFSNSRDGVILFASAAESSIQSHIARLSRVRFEQSIGIRKDHAWARTGRARTRAVRRPRKAALWRGNYCAVLASPDDAMLAHALLLLG